MGYFNDKSLLIDEMYGYMAENKLSQRQFAELLGICESQLNRWLKHGSSTGKSTCNISRLWEKEIRSKISQKL